MFFYYPSDEYISYLMTVEELEFLDEIDCQDLLKEKSERGYWYFRWERSKNNMIKLIATDVDGTLVKDGP